MDRSRQGLPSLDLKGVTVVFDLDGTLVDTAPDLIGALNVVLGESGLPPLPTSAARSLVGRGGRVLIERGFAADGRVLREEEAPALVDRFIAVYRSRIAEESRPFPGLEAALDVLTEAGARLAVCTNKPIHLSILLLDALKLSHRFQANVGAGSAPRPKPDPAPFLMAVAEAGGEAGRAIMVGDSETDVATARAAGAPVIAVPFGYTELSPEALGADILIPHFDALPAAVETLAARLKTIA
jgi:phosphoglycolate phosphatase